MFFTRLRCREHGQWMQVRVRRPNDYNPAAASSLGPSLPSQNLNLAAIGLGTVRNESVVAACSQSLT